MVSKSYHFFLHILSEFDRLTTFTATILVQDTITFHLNYRKNLPISFPNFLQYVFNTAVKVIVVERTSNGSQIFFAFLPY